MNTHNKGFSLIELMAVIGIVAVMGGFGLASYTRQTNMKVYEDETRKLINVLEISKQKAFANDGSVKCKSTYSTHPNLYSYIVTVSASSYTVSIKCDTDAGVVNPTAILLDSYSIDSRVRVTTTGIVEFKSATEVSSASSLKISSQKISGKNTCITVSSLGVIDSDTCT